VSSVCVGDVLDRECVYIHMRVLVGVGVGYVRGCMCVCVCASPHLGCSGMQTHTNSSSVSDYSLSTMAASSGALPGTAGRDTGELHGVAMHWQGLFVAQPIIMLLVYLLHLRHTR